MWLIDSRKSVLHCFPWHWWADKLLLHTVQSCRSISQGGYLRTLHNPALRQADGDLVCVCLVWLYLCLLHNHSHPLSFLHPQQSPSWSPPVVRSLGLDRSCRLTFLTSLPLCCLPKLWWIAFSSAFITLLSDWTNMIFFFPLPQSIRFCFALDTHVT